MRRYSWWVKMRPRVAANGPSKRILTYLYLRRHSPGAGWALTASSIELTTSRTETLQARQSCASSLDTFTQSFHHRAWPKTRGPEIGSRSALIVVAHVFSWPPARLRHVRGGVGRRRSLISSPSGRLVAHSLCALRVECGFLIAHRADFVRVLITAQKITKP